MAYGGVDAVAGDTTGTIIYFPYFPDSYFTVLRHEVSSIMYIINKQETK